MSEKLVRIYPVPGLYVIGEAAEEREVTEDEAKRLLKYQAFTDQPPKPAKTTEAPQDAGPSDSKEK